MSHSYHKHLYSSYCCINHSAQSKWKRDYNRIFRRNAKQNLTQFLQSATLQSANDDFYYANVKKQPFADMWVSPSDGFHPVTALRKDEFYQKIKTDNYCYYCRFESYTDYQNYFKKQYICK